MNLGKLGQTTIKNDSQIPGNFPIQQLLLWKKEEDETATNQSGAYLN